MEDLDRIVQLTNSIADPIERIKERRRLTQELYSEPFETKVNRLLDEGSSVQEIAAQTGRTVGEVRQAIDVEDDEDQADADEAEALAAIADAGLMLIAPSPLAPRIADTQEKLAGTFPHDSEIADRLRRNAEQMRRYAKPSNAQAAPAPPVLHCVPRPRERRERHVARATSSSDSGDAAGEPDDGPLARLRRAIRRTWRRA
jgi:hypothetical protein